jgi:predicted nuclease with TOPRIM domain
MRQQIETRLNALKAEYEKGQNQLRQLESQSASVRETLLRISGAIMVLEEVLASPSSTTNTEEQTPADVKPGEKKAAQAA